MDNVKLTDTQRLNFLQELLFECDYSDLAILCMTDKGFILKETKMSGGVHSIRDAIDNYYNQESNEQTT